MLFLCSDLSNGFYPTQNKTQNSYGGLQGPIQSASHLPLFLSPNFPHCSLFSSYTGFVTVHRTKQIGYHLRALHSVFYPVMFSMSESSAGWVSKEGPQLLSSGDQILVLCHEKELKATTKSEQESTSFIKAKVYT